MLEGWESFMLMLAALWLASVYSPFLSFFFLRLNFLFFFISTISFSRMCPRMHCLYYVTVDGGKRQLLFDVLLFTTGSWFLVPRSSIQSLALTPRIFRFIIYDSLTCPSRLKPPCLFSSSAQLKHCSCVLKNQILMLIMMGCI